MRQNLCGYFYAGAKQQVAYLVKRGKLKAVRVRAGTRQYWKIDVSSATCGRQPELF